MWCLKRWILNISPNFGFFYFTRKCLSGGGRQYLTMLLTYQKHTLGGPPSWGFWNPLQRQRKSTFKPRLWSKHATRAAVVQTRGLQPCTIFVTMQTLCTYPFTRDNTHSTHINTLMSGNSLTYVMTIFPAFVLFIYFLLKKTTTLNVTYCCRLLSEVEWL